MTVASLTERDVDKPTARYISTRGNGAPTTFDDALLTGLAPDGGLYLPMAWPRLSAEHLVPHHPRSYADLAHAALSPFVGEALSAQEVTTAIDHMVAGFRHAAVTPLKQIDEDLWLLELFHGPTLAFKDCAMRLMARLAPAALAKTGEDLLLITATSGDTGAAAVNAFAHAERIRLVVLHPEGRVSPVQHKQMTTVDAPNVLNLAVAGDFDDCQRMVKALLADPQLGRGARVSSVNSINWGRLAGQIPYYLAACRALDGPIRAITPTGNFGDAFAGWVARAMGAPIAAITAAVNQNDALARVLETGVYTRCPAQPSASVSMDVQAPSNFERLVFEASQRDAAVTTQLFADFAERGQARLPEGLHAALREEVHAIAVDEASTHAEIARTFQLSGDIICPHTAVGVAAARALPREGPPRVVLATAHPAKFPGAITAALGAPPPTPDAIAALDDLPVRAVSIAPDIEIAKAAIDTRWA